MDDRPAGAPDSFDAAGAFARHAAQTRFGDLPAEAVARAKTFLLDSLGVGLAGTSDANAGRVLAAASGWGSGADATAWGSGAELPAPSAAFVNAYLVHALEFDCIHERAIVHPMATLLSALFAWSERAARRGDPVSGRRFVAAMSVGVDVAGLLGSATRSGLRFFRPATAGGFGAAAALANAAGLAEAGVLNVLGLHFGQVSGTMQAHVEGSPALGLQIAANARAAVTAIDLAEAGLTGPKDMLNGPFGYYAMMEDGSFEPAPIEAELGRVPQLTRLSHKPYPSGRLSHGAVDGLRRLIAAHRFAPEAVAEVVVHVPPVVMRLMGRPNVPNPSSNYAKLCLPFVVGTYLARGRVDVPDFSTPEMRNDPAVHAFAGRVRLVPDDNPSQNAIAPQRVTVRLNGGERHEMIVPAIYGHPDAPLSEAENLEKFGRCCGYAHPPVPPELRDRLVALVARFDELEDVSVVPRLLAVERAS
ncbi:MmgE/PrpD family protein [Enterovirga aerilata]|uniref:MmgE/PrpD family protein n=1 Tax=Enterovirga aerilata TaxID=2730920 RepID=A0A849I276_9HYPH|nr:MmgE/PrpD family protein [Enterovirga sp. DB1703]NNM73482.1 MmgE/PrpD family protein [Enterovirga sp. DB1703]